MHQPRIQNIFFSVNNIHKEMQKLIDFCNRANDDLSKLLFTIIQLTTACLAWIKSKSGLPYTNSAFTIKREYNM